MSEEQTMTLTPEEQDYIDRVLTPEEEYADLLTHSPRFRRGVAQLASSSPALLTLLASDEDDEVRRAVACNHLTSPETLTLLASDEDRHVQRMVARNPFTPASTLTMLAQDEALVWVYAQVADNRNTPLETLNFFALSNSDEVRIAVAKNPSTPPETLTMLSSVNEYLAVRAGVARNSSTPLETLLIVSRTKSKSILRSLAENPSFTIVPVIKRLHSMEMLLCSEQIMVLVGHYRKLHKFDVDVPDAWIAKMYQL